MTRPYPSLLPAFLALGLLSLSGCSSRPESSSSAGYSRSQADSEALRKERAEAAEETARRWTRRGIDTAKLAAEKAVALAQWVGPKIRSGAQWAFEGAQELVEVYGPAVGAMVEEVYQTVGPLVGRAAKAVALDYGPRALRATRDFVVAAGQKVHEEVAPVAAGVFLGISKGVADSTGMTELARSTRSRWQEGLASLSKMRARWMGQAGSLDEVAPELLAETAGTSAREAAADQATGAMLSYSDAESFQTLEFEGLGGSLGELIRPQSGLSQGTRIRLRAALDARQRWRQQAAQGNLAEPTWIAELSDALRAARGERLSSQGTQP